MNKGFESDSSARKRGRNSAAATRTALEKARKETLRESFRLGGAMLDLQRASNAAQRAIMDTDRAVRKAPAKG